MFLIDNCNYSLIIISKSGIWIKRSIMKGFLKPVFKDPNTLNLDPDSGFWPNLDPDSDPGPDPDPG